MRKKMESNFGLLSMWPWSLQEVFLGRSLKDGRFAVIFLTCISVFNYAVLFM